MMSPLDLSKIREKEADDDSVTSRPIKGQERETEAAVSSYTHTPLAVSLVQRRPDVGKA